MEVKAEDFTNNNTNFSNVRFEIVNGGLTIEPKAITVTALRYTISFGEGAPEYDIDQNDLLSQLCGDDDVSVIVYHLGCDYSKDKDGNALVGVHDIVFQNPQEDQGNYKVSFVPGTLTVTAPDPQDFDYVTKTHADNDYYPGDTITYSIKVKNIFDEAAHVSITEQNGVTLEGAEGGVLIDTLSPGETGTYTATYVVKEEDLDENFNFTNTVDVTITPQGGSPVDDSATDEETINVPSLLVKKIITSVDQDEDGKYDLGEVIKYAISVTNNGNVRVSGITLRDAMDIGGTEKVPENWQDKTIVVLNPGETSYFQCEYTVKEEDLGGKTIVNTATATGSDPSEEDVVGEGDVETGTEERNPHMTVAKAVTNSGSGENGEFKLGETIQYKITLTNDGNVTLSSVSFRDYFGVTEDITTLVGEDITEKLTPVGEFNNVLKPSEFAEFTYSYEVQEEDLGKVVVNEVTSLSAFDDKDVPAVVDDEAAKVTSDVEDPNPHLTVTKTATSHPGPGGKYDLNDVITYDIVVENDGNVTINGITVVDIMKDSADNEIGTLDLDVDPFSLEPNEEKTIPVTYTVTEDDLGKTLKNYAFASAVDPTDPGEEVTGEGETDGEETEERTPGLKVEKTVISQPTHNGMFRRGDTVTYRITVTNTGNVTLADVTLEDELIVTFPNTGGQDTRLDNGKLIKATLKPDDTWTVECQYVITEEDEGKTVYNKAAATGADHEDNTAQDDATSEGIDVERRYTLVIHYVHGVTGESLHADHRSMHYAGDTWRVVSPTIDGFTTDAGAIRSPDEGMPAADLEFYVYYREVEDEPVEIPEEDPDEDPDEDPEPEPTEGPQEYIVDPDTYELVPIPEEETPLANVEAGEHTCCIMHFLLMLAAMTVLGFYTKSRKKHQARIFEMRRALAKEKGAQSDDEPQQP